MTKRALSPEQQAATKARRERFQELVNQLAKMDDQQRASFTAKMPAVITVEGHALSITNAILCVMQRANITVVGGFKQWRATGRAVRKGEHGLMIWFPKAKAGEAADDAQQVGTATDTRGEVRFLVGYVFDVTQTEPIETAAAV
jgi:hypothetical protein